MRILLIEDDYVLGEAVRDHIAADGHGVDWMRALGPAEEALATTAYDLVLLDLNLPDGHGIDLLRALRKRGVVTPVIILTAQDQIASRIDGLNAGADDYLVKPFNLSELSARLGAVARRYGGNPSPKLLLSDLEIDTALRSVVRDHHAVDLTAREWAVFERLIRSPGILVSKAQIEDALFEFGAEVESNAVEVYVSRLRKKLGRESVETVRGLGYRVKN